MAVDDKIVRAWTEAAADLGIRVVAPFHVVADSSSAEFEAYLPDFGSRAGVVAMSQLSRRKLSDLYWTSVLYESYQVYDRAHFIETLNDWGWFGEKEARPKWYAGLEYGR